MVAEPLEAVGGIAVGGVGVEVEGAEVDGGEVEDGGEVFAGGAVVGEVPVVGAGAVGEEAGAAKGDEVGGVEEFDVLAYFGGPGGEDLAAVAVGGFAAGLEWLGWVGV